MNRTIRNLIVAAPLATIALTLVPVGAANAGPNGPDVIVMPKPKPQPPKDIAIPTPPKPPKGPEDIAIPKPKPKGPQDKAPKPASKPQPKAPQAVAPKAAATTEVAETTAAVVVVESAKGSADSIDRSDTLFVSEPVEAELVVEETDGAMDLTWLLIGGGIVTASGIAVAARKRSNA